MSDTSSRHSNIVVSFAYHLCIHLSLFPGIFLSFSTHLYLLPLSCKILEEVEEVVTVYDSDDDIVTTSSLLLPAPFMLDTSDGGSVAGRTAGGDNLSFSRDVSEALLAWFREDNRISSPRVGMKMNRRGMAAIFGLVNYDSTPLGPRSSPYISNLTGSFNKLISSPFNQIKRT
jgi:hypothetical protein